jgi:predicted AlkP superfamily pyrophosphatase or phosphodiesterase
MLRGGETVKGMNVTSCRFSAAVVGLAATIGVFGGATTLPAQRGAPGNRQSARPGLIVLLVVDQFRADYVDWYSSQWTQGLHRLVTESAFYRAAAYPYGTTVTCAGHSTIGTGNLPNVHGMISNAWYDRAAARAVACTEDAAVESVAFGGATGTEHHSAKYLLNASFADTLREQHPGATRIVSLSMKARSAIGMAGHPGANTVVLWAEDNGAFATSSAFAKAPWPEVDAFVRAHPISRDSARVWTRLLQPAAYAFDDDAAGEAPPAGWGRTFPHALSGTTESKVEAAQTFAANWAHSPWSDAYLGEMAAALASRLRLGHQASTDMLAVSFSALDLVGHPYGPRSHEVQDVLLRLDITIGSLLDALDKELGRGSYVVAWSADHGVALLPEQAAPGADAGRVSTAQVRDAIEQTGREFAAGPIVENISAPNVYLSAKIRSELLSNSAARRVIASAVRGVTGVAEAYWADELASAAPTADPLLAANRLSYVADRSGDLVFVPRINWLATPTGTTHGTPYPYDQRVPLALMGAGIRPGTYDQSAGPMDIAPTLARLTGVTLPHTNGRVLSEALAR